MFCNDFAVDLQNRAFGIVQKVFDLGIHAAKLGQQFTHVRGPTTGGGLVGLGAHPLHQTGFVQSAHAHQHAADGAVAAHPIEAAFGECVFDHRQVHGVEDDDGVVLHAQGGGRVDPVALPTRAAQLGEHFRGVVAALAGDDDVAGFEGIYVVAVK